VKKKKDGDERRERSFKSLERIGKEKEGFSNKQKTHTARMLPW